jgi:hypothetical protein
MLIYEKVKKTIRTLFLCLLMLFDIYSGYSQRVELTELQMEKDMICSKIAWIENEKFCIIIDNSFSARRFSHQVFLFDKGGNLIHDPIKIKTFYSCQNDHCFTLGTTVYFLEDSHDFGIHRLYISGIISKEGMLNDSARQIFRISESDENSKLNKPHYKFSIYKGLRGTNALLTYNNDYKNNLKEGFRYRILDETGNLSEEKTFNLPYNDFECNINDIIYDDEKNKIFVLSDLFQIKDKDEREFKNSFVSKYEISSGNYNEIQTGVASFYRNKIQHTLTADKIAFAGISADIKETSKWSLSFILLSDDLQNVIFSDKQNLKLDNLNDFNKKKDLYEYFSPINFLAVNENMYNISWSNMLNPDQYAELSTSRTGAGASAGALAGVLGAAIGAGISAAMGISIRTSFLLLNYYPSIKKINENFISTESRKDDFYTFQSAVIESDKTPLWVINKPIEKKSRETSVCFLQMNNDTLSNDDDILFRLKANNINVIQASSLYQNNEADYFLTEKMHSTSLKHFLLKVNH